MTFNEVSQVSRSQKQALANAIKYVCIPTLTRRQTPQREFAGAKVQQKNDIHKFCMPFFENLIEIFIIYFNILTEASMT